MANDTPLRVEFTLSRPVVTGAFPIHLDSIIAYAVVEHAAAMGITGDMREVILNLPLSKAERQGDWCWMASALQFEPGQRSLRQWTRRTDREDYSARLVAGQIFSGNRRPETIEAAKAIIAKKLERPHALKIDTLRGDFKNHQQFFEVEASPKAVAWCIGNRQEIEALLSLEAGYVTSIGKRGTRGYGTIIATTISDAPEAAQLWSQRIVPWPEEGRVPITATIRPPYFDRTLAQIAWAFPG